jgi:hypothetical protein
LFVIAAGNRRANQRFPIGEGWLSPERYLAANDLPNLIVVAGSVQGGLPASRSFYGGTVSTAAPADRVLTLAPDGFRGQGGTSFAAPQVTNTAGKARLLAPEMTPAELKWIVEHTSTPMPAWLGKAAGGGPLDPAATLVVSAWISLVRRGATLAEAKERLAGAPAEMDLDRLEVIVEAGLREFKTLRR